MFTHSQNEGRVGYNGVYHDFTGCGDTGGWEWLAVLLVIGAGRADREIEEALRMQQWNARKVAPKETK